MKVYHGTISTCAENIIKNGIILNRGKPNVDFGQGFYTTTSYKFAKDTAINKAEKTNIHYGEEVVYPVIIEFNLNKYHIKKLNILQFNKCDISWAQFIINNRNGFGYMNDVKSHFHNIKHKFDIVIGAIADKKISLLAKELKALKKKVSKDDLYNIQYLYSTNQISFHTERSLSCLELVGCDMIETNKREGDVVNE